MSSLTPLVCICIPTYNAEKTIAATMRSVLGQTYQNILVHVVDNNSSDGTVSIVESFPDERITLFRSAVNASGEGNFNRCIALAKGKYTAIYHADDIYEPEMVATQVAFLEQHPQAGAVFTEALLIDEHDLPIGAIRQPKNLAAGGPLHYFPEVFKAILDHSNFLICPSVMALTSVYQDDIKSWRDELFGFGSSADLDVWLRMLQQGPIGIISKKLMRYRISQSQWSANVRIDTNRSAFFNVIDYYLAKHEVQMLLTDADMVNYERLECRDWVMRAANAMVAKQPEMARELCPDIFSMRALYAALQTRRGLAVFLLAFYIKLMLLLRLTGLAGVSLRHMKRMARK
jgi:glycosyltransferase involved in cell wall biosynthesis